MLSFSGRQSARQSTSCWELTAGVDRCHISRQDSRVQQSVGLKAGNCKGLIGKLFASIRQEVAKVEEERGAQPMALVLCQDSTTRPGTF